MNQLVDMKLAKIIASVLMAGFLVIHIAMLALFATYEVTPMVYFNIFSVVFYVLTFFLIRKGYLKTLVVTVYFEIVLHMCAAVYFVGWNCGFQVTLVGISVLSFFAEYVGRCMGEDHVPALPLCIIGACAYIIIFEIGAVFPPQYSLPSNVESALQIFWAIVTFGVSIASLQMFTLITFNSEKTLSSQTTHDELTGLPNRHFISGRLAEAVANPSAGCT